MTPSVRNLVVMNGRPFDVYVDSVNGSDSASGKSPGSAKQTFAAIGTITSGMRIGLARGSVFREQVSSAANGVLIKSYGSGARPIIDGSDAVAANEWQPTAGQANVYEVSRTSLAAFGGQHETLWLASGLAGTRASSLANCNSTPGSFFTDFTSGGVETAYKVYVHPAGSTDPRNNGVTYYAGERLYCINLSGDGTRVIGINTKRQLHHDGSLRLAGLNSFCDDCVTEEGYIHNHYLASGVVTSSTSPNPEFGYSYVSNPTVAGGVLTLTDVTANASPNTSGPALFMHAANNSRAVVTRLQSEGLETLFGSTDGRETIILNRCSHKAGTVGTNKRTIDYQNQFSAGASDLFIIRPTSISNILLYTNTLHAGSRVFVWEPVGINVQRAVYAVQCVEMHVIGGLLYTSGADSVMNWADPSARTNVTMKHCVLQQSDVFYLFAAGGTYTFDYNVYWKAAGGDRRWSADGTQSFNLANWQGRGYDANSVEGSNPLFSVAPSGISTLAGVETLFVDGKIGVSSELSPLVTVGAGPGRVPGSYTFPAWVPADVRAICLGARG
jgi:hypothetical protein